MAHTASDPGRSTPTRGRWGLVVAAVLVQLALGAVYAWSVFNKPLQQEFGWSKAEAVLPFEVAIGTIFIGSLIGGRIQDRRGPRPVALGGGVLYAVGNMLASLTSSSDQLWLLVLTYGVMGGIGLGAAYITPIAMLAKWFPDRRGLITGIAVAGFGFGAVIVAPVAKSLLNGTSHKPSVFLPLGIAYLIAILLGASFFRNPPSGYQVPGFTPTVGGRAVAGTRVYTLGEALRTPQWYLLTGILALNVACGIALISQASDAAQAITGASAATAATLVGILGLFNGAGRVVWAWLSDRTGRMQAFIGMLVLQAICFFILPHATAIALFAVLAALIYLAYGGGFGTMPATAADYFGTPNAGAVYGAMIVAWSIGGVTGPLVTALLYEASGKHYTVPFTVIAVVALVALILPPITRMPSEPGRPRPHNEVTGP
ncbi:L-lactate MFS transporter [Micromonospora inositola]|uniref:MFS transporter, OFA family, oxalate/formate antiporter n=1 Tax=Micromonospora inositola TaxID=47865 RepID=A0A1C5JIL9_9ACTN|nr:OFA family MFS transporter [Micromonospora inositola]SCG70444.1 MFS transporter, OFA family, oxalate/formate antiporter [Micromonospora inositola]